MVIVGVAKCPLERARRLVALGYLTFLSQHQLFVLYWAFVSEI